jgi:hypothetical protein
MPAGNDLARCLGWGAGSGAWQTEGVGAMLAEVQHAAPMHIDRQAAGSCRATRPASVLQLSWADLPHLHATCLQCLAKTACSVCPLDSPPLQVECVLCPAGTAAQRTTDAHR